MFVDTSRKYRNFEGFGASGAWWAQLVGGWPCRDEIVRLLYSPDDGIGLTAYRYNIGAGSARSGLGDIGNPLRRTDCFETAPGRYDFDRDREAVSVLRAAVRYGAKEVVFSHWSNVDEKRAAYRFVTSWATPKENIEKLGELL